MLWAGRVISWVLVVTGGITWTVGQAGLDATNRNLCDFATALWHLPIHNCQIVPLLVLLWQVGIVAAVAFCIFDLVRWTRKRLKAIRPQANYSFKDSALIDAMSWIAFRSAWGRWQAAQRGNDTSEETMLHLASSYLLTAAGNGDLVIRGRVSGTQRYEEIDRHFWLEHFIHYEHDPVHVWKAVVYDRPTNCIVAQAYDSYLVEQAAVEALWPQRDQKADWARRKIKAAQTVRLARSWGLRHVFISTIALLAVGAAIGGALSSFFSTQRSTSTVQTETKRSGSDVAAAAIPTLKSRPYYDDKEIGDMISALRTLDGIIDKKYAPAQQALNNILSNWEARVRADLSNIRIEDIQVARDQLVSARTDILHLFAENAFYKAEFNSVTVDENAANSSMQSALDQFIRDVRALARFNGDGVDLLHFATPALNRLQSENDKMRNWILKVKTAIETKTTELREWKKS